MGSFQLMKSLNRSLILNMIRSEGPISRAEIAKKTSLTPPTVSNLVKELIDTDIVMESNQGESRGGRKPTMLVINAKNFYIIGVDVGPSSIYSVLTNLNATVLDSVKINLTSSMTNGKLLEVLSDSIRQLFQRNAKIDQERMIGIGVAMHGIVDVENGISLYAPILQLRDVPIKEHLENEFKMAVKVENDARAMALGEAWFGNGRKTDEFVCVNVGEGIGAGIIINGKLYHGDDYLAGEIGHMTIDINGPKCSCGNYGCLQALAAGPFIAERMKKEIAMGQESLITEMAGGELGLITGELIYDAAVKGDQLSQRVLDETGRYLGIGLTNLIHTVNPKKVIMGGGVSKAGHFILDSIKKTIEQRGLTIQAKSTEITASKLGDQAAAIGGVALLLVELFATRSAE
ncbi:ROK family transcriptional regulator [Scopulibacillus darangshiensis]|nr:ROK family transcriptional regulator [Scopulibacillus darangshiensis]